MKYPKYGHAYATDYGARWTRHGLLTRKQAVGLAEQRDHALEKLYNPELFEKNEFGQWGLKKQFIEERRNPKW